MAEFTVEQISEDDIITGIPLILEDKIYWEDANDVEVVAINVLDISTREIATVAEVGDFSTLGGRFIDISDRTVSAETIGFDQNNGEDLVFTQDTDGDGTVEYFAYHENTVIEIPASFSANEIQTLDIDGGFATWVQGETFHTFNLGDSSLSETTIPDFFGSEAEGNGTAVNSSFIDENGELQVRVFFQGVGEGPISIGLFNGTETLSLSVTDEELSEQTEGNTFNYTERIRGVDRGNIVWVRDNTLATGIGVRQLYVYDGEDISVISDTGESPLPDTTTNITNARDRSIISGENVAFTSRTVDTTTEPNLTSENINFYDGTETRVIYQTEPSTETAFLTLLAVSGNRVVWLAPGEDDSNNLFLYDGSETKIIYEDLDLLDFFDVQLSENYVAWIDSDVNGDFQEQLFLYDGEETAQLTNLEPDNNNTIDSFEILDDGVVWIAEDDSVTGSSGGSEVFLATTDEENTSQNEDVTTVPNGVYRFFNQDTGVHFYTGNEAERDAVLELPNYSFEGASYQSIDPITGNPEPSPVYRFLNEDTGVHLYTISEVERDATQDLNNFSFEGEAFFAYETEVEGTIPIYRFFNTISGAHFYTPSEAERDNVEANLSDFQSEGIAYYALPLDE